MKNIFVGSLCIALLCACSAKFIPTEEIKDMQTLEQNALAYLPDSKQTQNSNPHTTSTLKKDYLQKYFSPWHEAPNPNKDEVFWITPSLLKTPGFGEHLQANSLAYTEQILESMQVDNYPNTNQKAIITTTTAVRAVPTLKPMFKKPDGYPFDRWQNSLIFTGTPVLITHTSTDRQWVHIQSSFVYGWVQAKHLATLNAKQIQEIESYKDYVTPTLDKLALIDMRGDFDSEARLGQIFAIQGKKQKNKPLKLISYTRTPDGKATKQILTPLNPSLESAFSEFPLTLEPLYIAQSINALLGQRYGWGGFLENRDCSAFIRDIFAQYAIHLPRNSKAQAFYGNNNIDLKKLNRKEKEAFIIANATPYQTILWLNGHIMLYIGELEGRAIVAHSVWSVITGKRFENLLTSVVITSLHVGEEKNNIFARSDLLIDRINAMSDLTTLVQKIQEGQ